MLDAIVADLPDWPHEICEKWLLPETEKKGWPPTGTNEWHYAITRERDLRYLQSLTWERKSEELSPQQLTIKSRGLIIDMFRGYYWKDPEEFTFSMFDGGRERFEGQIAYIQENGAFPWPPALERRSDGLEILDGYHRCLAYFYIQGWLKAREDDPNVTFDGSAFEFWISQNKNG